MTSISLAEKMAQRKADLLARSVSQSEALPENTPEIQPQSSLLNKAETSSKKDIHLHALSSIDLGIAVQAFFNDNPNATHLQAAVWAGFQNTNSGRVKISNALKLLQCDDDIISDVKMKLISTKAAFKIQTLRRKSSTLKSTSEHQKAKSKVKSSSLNLPLNNLKIAATIIQHFALVNGLDVERDNHNLNRRDIMKIFSEENLNSILNTVEK